MQTDKIPEQPYIKAIKSSADTPKKDSGSPKSHFIPLFLNHEVGNRSLRPFWTRRQFFQDITIFFDIWLSDRFNDVIFIDELNNRYREIYFDRNNGISFVNEPLIPYLQQIIQGNIAPPYGRTPFNPLNMQLETRHYKLFKKFRMVFSIHG